MHRFKVTKGGGVHASWGVTVIFAGVENGKKTGLYEPCAGGVVIKAIDFRHTGRASG